MKSMKLNTSAKYKNNKFQIKYLKAKKNDIILFAVYAANWDEEDNIFYRTYDFFIYFNRNKRAVHYIGNNCEQRSRVDSTCAYYGFISNNNMNSFMNSFQRNASEFLDEVIG